MAGLSKDTLLKVVQEGYEHHLKTANYLVAAHAAGLIACLALIKDYANTPMLKGIGFYIIVFGIGILASIAHYISLSFSRATAITDTIEERDADEFTKRFLALWHFGSVLVSLLAMIVAIVGLMIKFSSL